MNFSVIEPESTSAPSSGSIHSSGPPGSPRSAECWSYRGQRACAAPSAPLQTQGWGGSRQQIEVGVGSRLVSGQRRATNVINTNSLNASIAAAPKRSMPCPQPPLRCLTLQTKTTCAFIPGHKHFRIYSSPHPQHCVNPNLKFFKKAIKSFMPRTQHQAARRKGQVICQTGLKISQARPGRYH